MPGHEFTDRLMAVDRAVSSYIRFAGEPSPPPSETVPELWADLLHWHERFVIIDPPMSKREVRRFVNLAVKTFYEEREAIARGEHPLRGPRRVFSPEELEARMIYREQRDRVLARVGHGRPVPVERPIYEPMAEVPLPGGPFSISLENARNFLAATEVNPDGCDHCGRVEELFHNERTGLSLCDICTDMANEEEVDTPEPTPDPGPRHTLDF